MLPALFTDLYELTMAYGYWKAGAAFAGQEAAFVLSFRAPPFGGGFTLAGGLAGVIDYLRGLRFTDDDLAYLATLPGNDGQPLFDRDFLDFLKRFEFTCDVDAVPEGTVVFPHEPLVRVQGPVIQAQLVETALLNCVNFQSLIATKAARVCLAAGGDPVVEFGLRRAQGPDGGLTASRSAYIGGCAATSNVLAGKRFGIPVSGTMAHSWVMLFESEVEAFHAYAGALPNNCVLLVDTYNSIQGVHHAIAAGRRLNQCGFQLAGIRLDSGDLAFLSIEARRLLDQAGFAATAIVASNDLDEHLIASLKQQGARINLWGVGTRLVTADRQPALGGVYKLAAWRRPGGNWEPRLKLSDQAAKTSNPGLLQVRRFFAGELFDGDAIHDLSQPIPQRFTIIDPADITRRKQFDPAAEFEDLLVPIFRRGELVYEPPALPEIRARAQRQLARLHPTIKRLLNPHQYPAGLEQTLHERKMALILKWKGAPERAAS